MLSKHKIVFNVINGGVVSMLISSVVDYGFQTQSGQIKDYKIGIYCFSAKNTALRRRGNMFISLLLFQWANTVEMQLNMLA